ncbi:MAG: 1-phosphofructokinase [Clostridia bacterium]|nr:1-phosphofructokinase [Clostridia bacterium]
MVYTITLNPALDYVMKVGSLRFDDINRSKAEQIYYGGKGINVSVVLSRLGTENKALGFVAGFTGEELERMLKEDNIECDFNHLQNGLTRVNVKIKADTELDINANGPDVSEAEIEELLTKLDDIKEGDVLVLAGAVPKNLPSDVYEKILQRLSGKGVKFVVDATGELLLKVLKYKPFLVKPNHHELGDLFSVTTKTDEEIEIYAKKLQQMGASNVLVSRGGDGAMLIDEFGAVKKIGNAKGTLINSVGCGDSMVAGFVAGFLQKGDYEHALRLGAACGNATAFSEGLAEKKDIDRIYQIL